MFLGPLIPFGGAGVSLCVLLDPYPSAPDVTYPQCISSEGLREAESKEMGLSL